VRPTLRKRGPPALETFLRIFSISPPAPARPDKTAMLGAR
jgi:hypothetical protein